MITEKKPSAEPDLISSICREPKALRNIILALADKPATKPADAFSDTKPFVLAVAGLPGAGKTTLARALVERLGQAAGIHYDDYSPFLVGNRTAKRRLAMVAERSLKASLWDEAAAGADLEALIEGKAIRNIFTGRITRPAPVIVMDCLYGRAHARFGHLIDFAVAIDTPLEVSLARRLLQICRSGQAAADPADMCAQYLKVLQAYLEGNMRRSHIKIRQTALANADLILNGLLATKDQVKCVVDRAPETVGQFDG